MSSRVRRLVRRFSGGRRTKDLTRGGRVKQYYVYIMTKRKNGVRYIGVTNGLERRVCEHKHKVILGFTSQYNCIREVSDPKSHVARDPSETDLKPHRKEDSSLHFVAFRMTSCFLFFRYSDLWFLVGCLAGKSSLIKFLRVL